MMRTAEFICALAHAEEAGLVGGKGANLGRLIRAGFAVPGGFVVTTRAYRAAGGGGDESAPGILPSDITEEIREAYRGMGEGAVAVRSSATAEDMAQASMAGQYETFLDVEGEENLLEAVRKCWAGLESPRIAAYLREKGIDRAAVAMAVVVQKLVSAEVAGVLFTANPNEGEATGGVGGMRREMILEASWGLGESVVSGRVQPDILRLDHGNGRVIAATISDKQVFLAAGARGERLVEESRRRRACLRSRQVHEIWRLGRRAEEFFGSAQDIEWAIHEGTVFLLQSRPITTVAGDADVRLELLSAARRRLRAELDAGSGPWALHNLAETLPHPTPLTWSVIGRFMSGEGGFGAMYRMAGFEPGPAVGREGFLELICGRIYMDAARAPEMFFEKFPYAYDPEELRKSPDASQVPPTVPRGGAMEMVKAGRRLAKVQERMEKLAVTCDAELRDEHFPAMVRYVAEARKRDLAGLSGEELIVLWLEHEKRVLDEFGPRSLLPSLISGMALERLKAFLAENFWEESNEGLAEFLSSGGAVTRTLRADAELYEVGRGERGIEAWLAEHGHRAAGEFDLAAARWREEPEGGGLAEMARRMTEGGGDGPMERYERNQRKVRERIEELERGLSARGRKEFRRHLSLVHRYVAFREDGKDFLMLGYGLLRELALEAGRRLEVGGDIFHLSREEMFDALRIGFAPHHLIEERKAAWKAGMGLALPRVIEAEGVERLGRGGQTAAAVAESGRGHKAFAISRGRAAGPARILHSPTQAGDLGKGYVLVCPSTDPSWTPLFVNAAGLVLECGGTLSHGAVVAREMGLPAVVLPEATRIFADGERIEIDGTRGWVGREGDLEKADGKEADASGDAEIPAALMPPPAGAKDRMAARVRNMAAIFWGCFLLIAYLAPASWLYEPSMKVMDAVLWPVVRMGGKPAVVLVVAAVLALMTLLIQKFVTDNRRLLEAKRRAAALRKLADAAPAGSALEEKGYRLAASVQWRIFLASLVPIAILLGPMFLPFSWFKDRIDPAAWNAPAGSSVQIIATLDGEFTAPVQIRVPAPARLDESTPDVRTPRAIRSTLEHLLQLYRTAPESSGQPWELQSAPDPVQLARGQLADDLQAYLNAGLPPQGVTWRVLTPADFAGRFRVEVGPADSDRAGRGSAIEVNIGDDFAPAAALVAGPKGSPIRQLQVVYPRPTQKPVFWRPFGFIPFDLGWLGLYIVAYIPLIVIARWVLKVA